MRSNGKARDLAAPDNIGMTRSPAQFTLRHFALAIALFAVVLLLLREDFRIEFNIFLVFFGLVLCFAIDRISRLPLRARLVIEVTFALVLLACSAAIRAPRFDLSQASRAAELADRCWHHSADATDPAARAILSREARWFAKRSTTLRMTALWRGLTGGRPAEPSEPVNDVELIRQLGILHALEMHERAAERALERRQNPTVSRSP
jgi:hypothetical protein